MPLTISFIGVIAPSGIDRPMILSCLLITAGMTDGMNLIKEVILIFPNMNDIKLHRI